MVYVWEGLCRPSQKFLITLNTLAAGERFNYKLNDERKKRFRKKKDFIARIGRPKWWLEHLVVLEESGFNFYIIFLLTSIGKGGKESAF